MLYVTIDSWLLMLVLDLFLCIAELREPRTVLCLKLTGIISRLLGLLLEVISLISKLSLIEFGESLLRQMIILGQFGLVARCDILRQNVLQDLFLLIDVIVKDWQTGVSLLLQIVSNDFDLLFHLLIFLLSDLLIFRDNQIKDVHSAVFFVEYSSFDRWCMVGRLPADDGGLAFAAASR